MFGDLKEGLKILIRFAIIGVIACVSGAVWLSYQAIVWLGEWLHILAQ